MMDHLLFGIFTSPFRGENAISKVGENVQVRFAVRVDILLNGQGCQVNCCCRSGEGEYVVETTYGGYKDKLVLGM
jgi:hypothetical protein